MRTTTQWSKWCLSQMVRPGRAISTALLAAISFVLAAVASAQSHPAASPRVLDAREATRLLLEQVRPEYPAVAHDNYIQGQVQLELMVGTDGHVRRAHVLRGHPLLAASALNSVRKWIYRPLVTPAGPAPFNTLVKVVFDLHETDRTKYPASPERDLAEQVKAPKVIARSAASPDSLPMCLKVLVGDDGDVIDSTLVSGPTPLFSLAERTVARWKFQPARWGNLTVPWYLDVVVPVQTEDSPVTTATPERQ